LCVVCAGITKRRPVVLEPQTRPLVREGTSQIGFDTKTDRLIDRRSQRDLHLDLLSSSGGGLEYLRSSPVNLGHPVPRGYACGDLTPMLQECEM
jgi:hypothetical protein